MTLASFFRTFATGPCLLPVLILGGCSRCGDDGDDFPTLLQCAGSEYVDADFVDSHPNTWAMWKQTLIEVYVSESTFTVSGWYEQYMSGYFLVRWGQLEDGTLEQTETVCGLEASDVHIKTTVGTTRDIGTVIPQRAIDSVPPATWRAELTVVESAEDADVPGQVAYRLNESEYGRQYWVMGARLDNPETDICPLDPDDPAEWDQDEDGNPGITTEQWVNDELSARMYMCSRTLYAFEPGVVCYLEDEGRYQVQGYVADVLIDQSLYGTDNPPQNDPESRWSPNEYSFYVLQDLPDGATCADVLSAEFVVSTPAPSPTPSP